LEIAEQTVVGRITGGHVVGLTPTQIRTLINVADGANAYTHPNHSGDVTSVADGAQTIANSAVTLAKMANLAQNAIIGRVSAGAGVPEALTAANVRTIINVADGANAYVHPNHSGDVTSVADGAQTIATKAVTLAKMADMATASLIYRKTAGDGAPEVNTLATLKTDLGLTGTNSGDQTITLTGDVTGTGTGTFAATIATAAVSLAKMANLAQDKIIGRATASTGVPEAIACTAAGRALLDDASAADQRTTLGVGTGDSPAFTNLTLSTSIQIGMAQYHSPKSGNGPGYGMYKRGNATDSTGAVTAGGQLGYFPCHGWNGAAYYMGGYFMLEASENWSASACGTDLKYILTAPGAATRAEVMRIKGNGNVGIGTNAPNANAILDVTSTTKAFMPPRMTTTQRDAVSAPTEGMIIWNSTTHVLNCYNGSAWAAV
jgi:hypothetical protein